MSRSLVAELKGVCSKRFSKRKRETVVLWCEKRRRCWGKARMSKARWFGGGVFGEGCRSESARNIPPKLTDFAQSVILTDSTRKIDSSRARRCACKKKLHLYLMTKREEQHTLPLCARV